MRRSRALVTAVAAVTAGVVLLGCSAPSHDATPTQRLTLVSAGESTDASASVAPATASSSVATRPTPAPSTHARSTSAPMAPTPPSAGEPRCTSRTARIDVPAQHRDVAVKAETHVANIQALDVTVTNVSSAPCRAQGWPTVVASGNCVQQVCHPGAPSQFPVTRVAGSADAVDLAPGATTVFSLTWSFVGWCLEEPDALDITFPGDDLPMHLSPVDVCTHTDEDDLQVTAIGSVADWSAPPS